MLACCNEQVRRNRRGERSMNDKRVHFEEFRGYRLEVRQYKGAFWASAQKHNTQLEGIPRATLNEAINQVRLEALKSEAGDNANPGCLIDCITGELIYQNFGAEKAQDFPYGENYLALDLDREIVDIGGCLVCMVVVPE